MSPSAGKKPVESTTRVKAEAQLAHHPVTELLPAADLLHELQVHQVELEIQNETLRLAQTELEDSRDRYVELYEFAPVGYLMLSREGQITSINLTGAALFGEDRKKLLRRRIDRLIAPEDRERWQRYFVHAMQHDDKQICELTLQRSDDTRFYVRLDSRLTKADVAAPVMRITLTDITARKQAEEALVKAGALQSAIFNSTNFSSIATDARGVIQIFNVGAERMLGYTAADVVNKLTPANLSDPQEVVARAKALSAEFGTKITPGFEALVYKASRGIEDIYELTKIRKDGGRFPAMVSVTALRDAQNAIVGYLLIGTDNTARQQIEAARALLEHTLQEKNTELERAMFVAEKASLAKSEFLSRMSHELRTPLNAILGFAQLIESGSPPPTPTQKRSIDQVLHAGWYLLELINEILDLALIESGKLSLSMESISILEVLHDCQAMIEPLAQRSDIRLSFPQSDDHYFVHVDRIRIKQVLINLLTNAIKYNRVGGSVEVTCSAITNERLQINVRDTGEGLPPEKLAQLFQPFNRLGQEAGAEEGTGIGLVVSKRLVELMGGEVGAESVVGAGSMFWIELNLASELQFAPDAIEPAALPEASTLHGAALHTVLYVEDNRANMQLVEQLIERRPDMRLLTAGDGIRGIALARIQQPDVILMDINLPGISGIQALKILRDDPVTAHIPVLALSANAMPRDIENGLAAGFFYYLTKPIKVTEFMEALDLGLILAAAARAAANKVKDTQ